MSNQQKEPLEMNLFRRITRFVAPRVSRELEQLRGLREVRLAEAAPATAPAPLAEAGAKSPVPSTADIQDAARLYDLAREQSNAAARTKRRAEKTLSRTPDGTYGAVTVERAESGLQTADLDAIRAILANHHGTDQRRLGNLPPQPDHTCVDVNLQNRHIDTGP